MKSRTRLAGALLVAGTLGAACASDDPDTNTQAGKASDTLTRTELIAAADEICADYNDQMDEIFGALFTGEEPQPAAVQENLGKVLDLYGEQWGELRGLTPPKADEAKIEALLDEGDKVVADTRTLIADPAEAMAILQSDEDPMSGLDEKMAEYGFANCAGEREEETESFGGDELTSEEAAAATKVEVTAVEYAYQGVPATLPAGPAIFSFTNAGGENHEIGIVKIKDGLSAEEVIAKATADSDDESFIDRFLGAGYALPGEATDLSVRLQPGLYGYGCFVETDEGASHASHGMISTFTVAG